MDGIELLVWRKEQKITQAQLATFLGVSRNAVNGWECGRHRPPMNLRSRLPLRIEGNKPVYEFVSPNMRDLYPHLDLYEIVLTSTRGKRPMASLDHPRRVLPHLYAHVEKIPIAVLDSDEYKAALLLRDSKKKGYITTS